MFLLQTPPSQPPHHLNLGPGKAGSCVRQVKGRNLRFSAVPLRTKENTEKPWFSVGLMGVHSSLSCKLHSASCCLYAACCAQQHSMPTYKDSNYSFWPVLWENKSLSVCLFCRLICSSTLVKHQKCFLKGFTPSWNWGIWRETSCSTTGQSRGEWAVRSEPPEEPATALRHCRPKVGHADEHIY